MNEVKATLLADTDDIFSESPLAPGTYKFFGRASEPEAEAGMLFVCPCGCGELGSLQFDGPNAEAARPKWQWNGSRESPTLTPSILKRCACKWHGYLTDGVFKQC